MKNDSWCELHRYNVMLQCWHDSPGLRPSFSDLVSELDRILALCVSEVDYKLYNYC